MCKKCEATLVDLAREIGDFVGCSTECPGCGMLLNVTRQRTPIRANQNSLDAVAMANEAIAIANGALDRLDRVREIIDEHPENRFGSFYGEILAALDDSGDDE